MVEAVVLWNEPNNLSHWNFKLDPDWVKFGELVRRGSEAIRAVNPRLPIVLGGVSACDCDFLCLMKRHGVIEHVDVVGVHGFPLDWNHWQINDWPAKIDEAVKVSGKPVWVLEVGASSFGAEEVAAFGLARTVELLKGKTDRVHWYSLFDLPATWPAETRHKEAEGSSYYRHYYLGVVREDGTPKQSWGKFPRDGSVGFCQWFHFDDPRVAAVFGSRMLNGNAPLVFEDGEQMRDFVSIHDIVRANLLAMERRESDGEVINVGSGKPITICRVAQLLASELKIDVQPVITNKFRAGDIRHCFADISKAQKLLGYKPQVTHEAGFRELAEWLGGQHAEDRAEAMLKELSTHGLTA